MNKIKLKLILFIFAFILAFLAPIRGHAVEVKKTTINGMTILHVERQAVPLIAITFLIKASPLTEHPEKAGLANLTAKMLQEGTSKRKSFEISEEIEFLGASLGVSVNRDYTTLTMSILKKDLDKGLEIFADILTNPSFPESEVKRRKDLIKGSLKQSEEDPSYAASKAFIKDVFGSHPYGRVIEGSPESLDNIQREDIVRFYNQYYLPQFSILSVVGDIKSDELYKLLNSHLSGWLKKTKLHQASIESSMASPPILTSPKITVLDRDISQANIILGHKGVSRENPDYYDIVVMNYILGGGGFASRLMKTLRDEMGLTYSIYSSFSANKEPGEFSVEIQTKNESAVVAIKEILKQMQKIKKEPVAAQELSDAKSFLTGSFPRRLETSRKIADFLSAIEFYNLGDDYIKKYPEYINKVALKSLQKAAEKYLDPENYFIVIAGKKEKIDLSELNQLKNLK
jgi:zinc protease